jgi:hypothetical protein
MTSLIRLTLASLLLLPVSLHAQSPSPPAETSGEQLINAKALDALVAPIALYPDTLLAQVLIASTYPLEVVQADRWSKEHKKLASAFDDEHQTRVDTKARRCRARSTTGRYGCHSAAALKGLREREPKDYQGTEGDGEAGG